MKRLLTAILALCLSPFIAAAQTSTPQTSNAAPPAPQTAERIAADTPKTTVLGNTFIAPKDWSVRVQGSATILEAPEGDTWIALIDLQAPDADAAVAAAWKIYKPEAKWPLEVTHDLPDKDGWTHRRLYDYQTSPNEKRSVGEIGRASCRERV